MNTGEADPGELGGQPRPLPPPHALTVHELVEAATRAAQRQHVQGLEVGEDLDPDLVRDGEDPLLGGRGRHVQLHEEAGVTVTQSDTQCHCILSLNHPKGCLRTVCCVSE